MELNDLYDYHSSMRCKCEKVSNISLYRISWYDEVINTLLIIKAISYRTMRLNDLYDYYAQCHEVQMWESVKNLLKKC